MVVGILAVLSLTVASFAACTCSHHEPPTPKASCHGPVHHEQDLPNADAPSYGESCVCVGPPNESSFKAETFKFKNQPAQVGSAIKTGQVADPLYVDPGIARQNVGRYDRLTFASVHSRGPPVS